MVENTNNGTSQNDLINAMSDKQLADFKVMYKDNPKVIALIDSILEGRKQEAIKAKVKSDFEAKIANLAKLPPPPDGIYNIYMVYGDVDDTSKPEVVKLTDAKTGVVTEETRYPKIKAWTIATNHADQIRRGTGSNAANGDTTSKRAITVYKRAGNQLETQGNFRSGSKACDFLKLDYAGNSAVRVLRDNGYIVESYSGTDFKA